MSVSAAESAVDNSVRMPPAQSDGIEQAKPLGKQCSVCPMQHLCLPSAMNGVTRARLDSVKFTRRKVRAGQKLYCEGERFHYVHAVRFGTLKSSLTGAGGREQVSGFHLAGELVGLDGVANGHHRTTTMALEDTELCAISYGHLSELTVGDNGMQHTISRLMSREILRKHSLMMVLGTMTAEARLATFLIDLSQRYAARGYSRREFHLRMSRAEIASYLGMELETVSRGFSTFRRKGFLDVKARHIRNLDLDRLARRSRSVAGENAEPEPVAGCFRLIGG